jgi:hypothetical protein
MHFTERALASLQFQTSFIVQLSQASLTLVICIYPKDGIKEPTTVMSSSALYCDSNSPVHEYCRARLETN